MIQVTNKSRRRLGLPGRSALLLDPGQTVEVTAEQAQELRSIKSVAQWLERGVITLNGSAAPEVEVVVAVQQKAAQPDPALPEGVTGVGIELHGIGGGWYKVFVNGFEVSDGSVRKAEAEAIAKEYE